MLGPNTEEAAGAAMSVALTKAARRAPSPLNGERAGVRGEIKAKIHCTKTEMLWLKASGGGNTSPSRQV